MAGGLRFPRSSTRRSQGPSKRLDVLLNVFLVPVPIALKMGNREIGEPMSTVTLRSRLRSPQLPPRLVRPQEAQEVTSAEEEDASRKANVDIFARVDHDGLSTHRVSPSLPAQTGQVGPVVQELGMATSY